MMLFPFLKLIGFVLSAPILVTNAAYSVQSDNGLTAVLSDSGELNPVVTEMTGRTSLAFSPDDSLVTVTVQLTEAEGVTEVNLYCGNGPENPAVASLYASDNGDLFKIAVAKTLADQDLSGGGCDPKIASVADLHKAALEGNLFVEVKSEEYPHGEIRGRWFVGTQAKAQNQLARALSSL